MQAENRQQLLDAAFSRTLAQFRDEVRRGERHPAGEIGQYQRQQRDYASWLRRETPAPEAIELAGKLLGERRLELDETEFKAFALETTRMLIELYEAFLAEADQPGKR